MSQPSPLARVAWAIATFAERSSARVHVERRPSGYRWGPAHPGGPYANLREVARFLGIDAHGVVVHSGALEGQSVVMPPDAPTPRAARAFIVPTTDRAALARAIEAALSPAVANKRRGSD